MHSTQLILINLLKFLNLMSESLSFNQCIPFCHLLVFKLVEKFDYFFVSFRMVILLLLISINPTLSRLLLRTDYILLWSNLITKLFLLYICLLLKGDSLDLHIINLSIEVLDFLGQTINLHSMSVDNLLPLLNDLPRFFENLNLLSQSLLSMISSSIHFLKFFDWLLMVLNQNFMLIL